jgi:Ras-related protein Rab-11A
LAKYQLLCSVLMCLSGENNLSFIETSALDASNVELAFQNILTGTLGNLQMLELSQQRLKHMSTNNYIEIYRIVSAKTLDNGGDSAQANLGAGTNISLSKPADEGAAKGGKCC